VKDAPPHEDLFLWEEDGFYNILRKRVSERFKNRNYKATWFIQVKIILLLSLYLFCWTNAFLTGNFLWAIASGIFTEMVGFCLMHDASHNAVSSRPSVNYAGLLWSSWTLWNHWIWLQHHVYGHHSYTGIYGKDPDIHNVQLFVRKHTRMPVGTLHRYQHWYSWIVYMVFPNQHLGQAILYQLFPRMFKTIFVTPTIDPPSYINVHSKIVMTLSFVWHFFIPLYFQPLWVVVCLWMLNYTFMGISYFLNVAPNHDTFSTHLNHPEENSLVDWGENQVRCTANHSVGLGFLDQLITQLWGGMNFQIEHHLFPSLNHAHYYEVSKIVQQTCAEFNIPYNNEITWLRSVRGFFLYVKCLAKTPRFGAPWKASPTAAKLFKKSS
jgi:linoleoyl-CoA desaturase